MRNFWKRMRGIMKRVLKLSLVTGLKVIAGAVLVPLLVSTSSTALSGTESRPNMNVS